jgi:preprotein translocase subunit YajC
MKKNKMLKLGLTVVLVFSLLFIGGCVPAETPEGEGEFPWTTVIFLVLIFGIFYFLMIRPQRRKQKEHQHMTEELRVGDRIITVGGIYGKIESLSQDSVILKVESGTTIRVARASIAGRQER